MEKCNTKNEKLYKLRVENGYTQREMAELLAVSPATYSSYENGHIDMSLAVCKKLSELFDVQMEKLL